MPIDEELLAGLTEEERAQMLEEDEQDGAGQGEGEEGSDGTATGEAGADDDKGGADGAGAGSGEDGGAAGNDGGASGEDRAGPEVAHAPILVAEAPADAEDRLEQIAQQKAELVDKFDDGELTAKEYQQQLDALGREERVIERQLDKAQIAAELEQQRQVNERESAINSFLSEHQIKRDPTDLRFIALDGAVRLVASREENAALGPREILQKAYDECVAQGMLQPRKAAADPAKPAPKRKPIDAPPTLAKVPAADMTDTDEGSRFAHIDRLDPVAREEALMRMSDADRDAYLKYA